MNDLKFYIGFILLLIISCNNKQKEYLNISNDIQYVGMNQCAACHQSQYKSFINTGMGKSIRSAVQSNSSLLSQQSIYDSLLNFHYVPYWVNDSLFLQEYELSNNDTIHYLNYHIDYIVGSGHHTNSHLLKNNGYLYQAPFTYYTQDSILDLPPGFENNENSRFSRKMGLECIACHNAYPDFVLGSENKYNSIPTGIDCERCHGPGELHLEKIKNNIITDTAKYIDYTIINPSDLSIDLQNDLCARCHLQGNAVLTNNSSFFDFRPGMYLKEVMDVYLPRYSNSENDFIMASHVDRMKLSNCYMKSEENLSCTSCHDPHISVHKMPENFFNSRCMDCHNLIDCKENDNTKQQLNNDCVMCHMPQSNTIDIPHVTITDHKIRVIKEDSIRKKNLLVRDFLGLECINNDNPSNLSLAKAYLQQYERFESNPIYLDSAKMYLNRIDLNSHEGFDVYIYYLFLKKEYNLIVEKVSSLDIDSLLSYHLIEKEYNNKDAWTCYRIGESFMIQKSYYESLQFYQQSVKLAPYNLEFRNKYGVSLFHENNIEFAIDEFKFIISEDNKFVSAYTNLGYVYFSLNQLSKSLSYYDYALTLNPNHEKTLINKAQLLLFDNKIKDAFICANKLLRLNPEHEEGLILLNELNEIY